MNTKDIEEIVEDLAIKVTDYGYNDEYGYYHDWKDGVTPIIREALTTLTQHHEAEVERAVEENDNLRSLLRECEPFLSDGGALTTTLEYVTPAEQMRRAADRMDYKAALKQRIKEALTPDNTPKD